MTRDFDVVVVGGGTAGLTAALAARYEGATVALVERDGRLGGDCTFYGCVPSKALIEIAQTVSDTRRLVEDGVMTSVPVLDFGAIVERQRLIVAEIARDERDERFTSVGIELVYGRASFLGSRELGVDMAGSARWPSRSRASIVPASDATRTASSSSSRPGAHCSAGSAAGNSSALRSSGLVPAS